jgi:hemerythrin
MKFEWKDEYSVGVEEINTQHKKIIGLINDLDAAVHAGNTKEDLDKIINDLNDYAKFHLATEEKYFDEFNYPDKEEHKKRHDTYVIKVTDFDDKIKKLDENGAIKLAFEMIDFLEDWWVNHILYEDKKYTKTFNDHGLF